MRTAWIAVVAAVAVAIGSAGAASPGGDEGRQLFTTYCASCHGREARGDGPVAEALRERPGDLTALARTNGGMFPAEQVRRAVDGRQPHTRAHGSIEMPVWGDAFVRRGGLTEEQARARIDAIVRYLAAIQQRTA